MTTMTSTPSTGGKRKVNKGLKDWVTFVKKVQKEEGCSYKDAIHKAKVRKDKGEKWMSGGGADTDAMEQGEALANSVANSVIATTSSEESALSDEGVGEALANSVGESVLAEGGRRRRRTMRRSRGRGRSQRRSRGRSRGRGRARASRRS